jgi:predicted nucleotidyltransferase
VTETLFPPTVARVNCVLALNPGAPFSVADLGRFAGQPHSPTKSALETLVRRRIAKAIRQNDMILYEPNRSSVAFGVAYLAALVDLPWGESLSAAGLAYPRVSAVFVHGSAARGELRRDSDLDIAVVGETTAAAVYGALGQIERITGRTIDVACYSPDEVISGARRAAAFSTLLPGAVRVYGEWS